MHALDDLGSVNTVYRQLTLDKIHQQKLTIQELTAYHDLFKTCVE